MNKKELRDKLAQKKGVPFLETCLEFETPVSFEGSIWVWYQDAETEWELRLREDLHTIPLEAFTVPAPQMHEIAKKLPINIWHNDLRDYIFLGVSCSRLYYDLSEDAIIFEEEIQNHHYAQACASLYLKLKEANLLEK